MTRSLLLFLFGLPYLLCAQVNFLPAYFIDNSGTRTEVELRVPSWNNNPSKISYRLPGSDQLLTEKIADVQEFGLRDNRIRYQRFVVDIDQSSSRTEELSYSEMPVFLKDTVFLKVLVDGMGDLFYWEQNNFHWYFFRVGDAPAEQLIFRRYRKESILIETDDSFRRQLAGKMNCFGQYPPRAVDLTYSQADLVAFVRSYNDCEGVVSTVYENSAGPAQLYFGIRAGAEQLQVDVTNESSFGTIRADIGNSTNVRAGVEAKVYLPFTNNRSSLFLEAAYRSLRLRDELGERSYSLNHASVNIVLGTRYHIHVGNKLTFLLSAAPFLDLPFSEASIDRTFRGRPTIQRAIRAKRFGMKVGTGVGFTNKLALELYYQPRRNLVAEAAPVDVLATGFSLMATYYLGNSGR